MMQGRIIRGIAGFYYVLTKDNELYACRARGIFRKTGVKPLVGDAVEFSVTDPKDMEGNVEKILPRRNELLRPAVSNVDQALLLFAVQKPRPSLLLLDRLMLFISGKTGEGVDEVLSLLKARTTVLAGPSGVGKSTLINRIWPEAGMETGSVSKKLERGKHTTRHAELISAGEDTFLVDTPGFSVIALPVISQLAKSALCSGLLSSMFIFLNRTR